MSTTSGMERRRKPAKRGRSYYMLSGDSGTGGQHHRKLHGIDLKVWYEPVYSIIDGKVDDMGYDGDPALAADRT
jgi:hypothetical protein